MFVPLQRKFVTEENGEAKKEGKLYKSFQEWVHKMYGDRIATFTTTDWEGIIDKDLGTIFGRPQNTNYAHLSACSPSSI